MIKFNRFFSVLFTGLLMAYLPMAQADTQQSDYDNQAGGNRTFTPVTNTGDPLRQPSYGKEIGNKALNAFANLTTSPLEIPKNIINTTNQSNFFYGVFGGFIKGLVNTLGRMGCGVADLLTFPLPTKPIAYPLYVWDDFDVDTTYGDVYRLNKIQETRQPVAETPAPTAMATPPKAAVVNRSEQYNQKTSSKLDALFSKEMQK